jgi:hypothetical protein
MLTRAADSGVPSRGVKRAFTDAARVGHSEKYFRELRRATIVIPIQISKSQSFAVRFSRAPDALPPSPAGYGGQVSPACPSKRAWREDGRGAERRQALVRKRRTRWSVSRADPSPDRRRSPASDVGRRAFRRSAAAFSLRRRAALSMELFHSMSASSWRGIIVSPGGAPTPPGYRLRAGSAGAAPTKARNCRAPAAGSVMGRISSPSSGLLHAQDAS